MNAPETLPAAVLLPPSSLLPSPTNPRKHFDPAKLAELAERITEHGVIQPILVRQWLVGMAMPKGMTYGDLADMNAHEIACG
ncbi:ParB N-terminal domain-containing protein, partial [Lactococcus petauri]|uniref:ParB N-terminal domain-containing protein n=1 Tax=Lactococcus petauri TaxID=1940789 RepID=UPI0021F0D5AC